MGVVIGVDVATAAVRAVAADLDGSVLATESVPLQPVRRVGCRSEQDPGYADAARAVLGRVAHTIGPRSRDVVALSVTGTSGTVVPCDRRAVPVGPALMYDDRRAAALTHELAAATDGLPQQALLATPTSALARIAWLQRTAPAPTYLSTPDVVLAELAGHPVAADTSHTLKSGADPVAVAWPAGALTALGIRQDALPPLVAPATSVGVVADAVATDLGLPAKVNLVAGMTDGCTAQIATAAVTPGTTVGVLGTTLVLKGVAATPVHGFDGAVYSHRSPTGDFWPGGASNAGAGVLQDPPGSADLVVSDLAASDLAAAGLAVSDLAAADAAALAHGPSSMLRYPLVGKGERFPFVAPEAYGFTVGPGDDATDRHRAALEGVAFVERLGLERLRARGVESSRHHAAGGGSRSTAWMRIRASVLGCPLHRSAEAGSGFGAAVLAASPAHGGLAEATRAMVRTELTVDPDESERDALDERYHELLDELAVRGWLVAETTQR